jgi:hypothetical protein
LESRLQFIDFRLRWERRINRMDLTEHFGISVPQASLDIAKYTELAPNNLTYDRSSKTYTAAPSFHPLYQRSSAQHYLAELLATKMGVIEPAASFIGSAPEADWAPSPWRTINEQTVEAVVRAIRQQEAIWVSYQSMTSLDESVRLLSPHALATTVFAGTCARFATSASASAISSSPESCASMASRRAKWTPARIRIGKLY